MPTTLKIRFTGMWVYSPAREIHSPNNEVDILAVETRGDPFPRDHWHHPFLIIEREHLTAENWLDSKIFASPDAEGRWLAFLLDGRELSLRDAAPNNLSFRLPLGEIDDMPECPASPAEEVDFRWLASMGRFHPGQGRVERDVLQRPQSHRARSAARVHLSQGEMGTLFVSRDCAGEIIRWNLRRGREPINRALADMMEYSVTLDAPHAWFSDELWGATNTPTKNAIQLTPKEGHSEIVAYLKVVTFEHLWRVEPQCSRRDTIHHFHLLNRVFPGNLPLQDPEPVDGCESWEPAGTLLGECLPEDKRVGRLFPLDPFRFNDPQCPGLAADPTP